MSQERHFDVSLLELKQQLLTMGGQVEKAIQYATEALLEWNPAKIATVFEVEKIVNQLHMSVDDGCIKLLATQQPMAMDLRMVVAILKINTDLERMGDQAVNIAYNVEQYLKRSPLKPLIDLPRMSSEVRYMVRESLDAFVRSSSDEARDVLRKDDTVDALKHKIFRDVLEHLKTAPSEIEQGLSLILIARNLERIGDHATNIAEDVIFAVSGDDVRHSPRATTMPEAIKELIK